MKKRFGRLARRWALAFAVAGLGFAGGASATLIDRGGGMIYDDQLDITWLQDANYAKSSGFDSDGLMNWANANAWATGLVYGGFDDWRLARSSKFSPQTSLHTCQFGDAAACVSFGNELGYMYYFNFGANFGQDRTGNQTVGGVTLNNIQSRYWSGTLHDVFEPWVFRFDSGSTNPDFFNREHFAWAVRPGDVAAAPEPASLLLVGLGALGLAWSRRSGRRR